MGRRRMRVVMGPWPVDRAVARSLGTLDYFTGEPCVNGHLSIRRTSSGKCFECERMSWEKVRRRMGQSPFRPNEVKRAAAAAGEKYYQGNPCPHGHDGTRWTHNGGCVECSIERSRAYHKTPEGKAYLASWREANWESVRAHIAAMKASRRAAEGKFTAEDVRRLLAEQGSQCAICGVGVAASYHVDHIVPLARGGTNWPDNIQVLCPPCNLSKGAKTMAEFLAYRAANDNVLQTTVARVS